MNIDIWKNICLTVVATVLSAVGAVLFWNHMVGTKRAEQIPKVQAVQRYLELNPDVGFLWQKNLNVTFSEKDSWLDSKLEGIDPVPYITDGYGFRNHSDAIAALGKGNPDIIGLGDSFVHDAAMVFFRVFADHRRSYYSMAMHRQCPPQYNKILTSYALRHRPKHILYGVYENDFLETMDFRKWKQSGMDWFTYHSGTWCGPAVTSRQVAETSLNGENPYQDVLDRILEANAICISNGIRFTLMLIPSKAYVVSGDRSSVYETEYYDRIRREVDMRGISVIDIREVFAKETNSESLYWKLDGHWSYRGMEVAARSFLRTLKKQAKFSGVYE